MRRPDTRCIFSGVVGQASLAGMRSVVATFCYETIEQRQQTALFEISGRTVSTCTMCGGGTTASADDHQTLTCESCGAILDRKKNGAANAWAATSEGIEDRVREYWSETIAEAQRRDEAKQATLLRMQEGRRKARTASNDENQAGSRTDKVA